VLNTLNQDVSRTLKVMLLGVIVGFLIQVARKWLLESARYKAWKTTSTGAKITDFVLDALILASPYASSFGGFVDFDASMWWGLGGVFASVFNFFAKRRQTTKPITDTEIELPEDMSAMSLVGGGLIAGESLFALYLGISSLIEKGALGKLFGAG